MVAAHAHLWLLTCCSVVLGVIFVAFHWEIYELISIQLYFSKDDDGFMNIFLYVVARFYKK